MIDERCARTPVPGSLPPDPDAVAAALQNSTLAAVRIDEERARRFTVASLHDDNDVRWELLDSLNECPHCLIGVVTALGHWLTSELIDLHETEEAAITSVERKLSDGIAERLSEDDS